MPHQKDKNTGSSDAADRIADEQLRGRADKSEDEFDEVTEDIDDVDEMDEEDDDEGTF
jgi:hypothetical protein